MDDARWEEEFRKIYAKARRAYLDGATDAATCIAAADRPFLAGIGCSAQELFDLVEDDVTVGEPGIDRAVGITRVRREYFREVDGGRASGRTLGAADIPSPSATLGGIAWLPRILAKARAKLRGELPPELMYSCGGDRRFLRDNGLEADAFLKAVWKAGDDEASILDYVRRRGRDRSVPDA